MRGDRSAEARMSGWYRGSSECREFKKPRSRVRKVRQVQGLICGGEKGDTLALAYLQRLLNASLAWILRHIQ